MTSRVTTRPFKAGRSALGDSGSVGDAWRPGMESQHPGPSTTDTTEPRRSTRRRGGSGRGQPAGRGTPAGIAPETGPG